MQIVSARILEGPNIYSFNPVIKVRLNLGSLADVPSSKIDGFNDNLLSMLPSLWQHSCSLGHPGGFVERLKEGTYLAHIFEHVLLELQCLAGYKVSFGKARSAGQPGLYDVVAGFRNEKAALAAVRAAETLLRAAQSGELMGTKELVDGIRRTGEAYELGPSTQAVFDAARRRNIPVRRLGEDNLLILGFGRQQRRLWATTSSLTGSIASELACDKQLTKEVLAQGGLPVPAGLIVTSQAEAADALETVNLPAVIKPLCGNQGKGVTLGVTTTGEAERAFLIASDYGPKVLVEEYIEGRQYRLCIVNGCMVAAAERIPAYVMGDGSHSVKELVDIVNAEPVRGEGHEKPLTKIRIDAVGIGVLAKQNLTPRSVPARGTVVYLRENANLSSGGTAVDVTEMVHPENRRVAERAAELIGLDIAGVDMVIPDISKPIGDGYGAVVEVNAAPGIRMHHYPTAGKPRDVAQSIVEYLFPDDSDGRIPVISITGTNGKTTVTRMIGHIWQQAGYVVGMTTTDGIYINGQCVRRGDTTGPASARTILYDPAVEVAVLETARGGILRGGLAFDQCDVGIITNITEDHLGQDGVEDLDDLAFIKSLVLEAVKPEGIALLNADDPYVTALASRARCEIVYFSTEPDNIIIRRHLGIGGKAFLVKNNTVFIAHGGQAKALIRVSEIPIALGGIAQHNVQNAVIAAAACSVMKLSLASIRQGLAGFEQNPGRLNLMSIRDFQVCIDYGHNPAGYQALVNTVRRMGAARLIGVIAAPGDRRDDVIIKIGRIAGRGFDWIIIKEDDDLRGRQPGETARLLGEGVLETGYDLRRVQTVLPEYEAVTAALHFAKPDDLIVVFYEKYDVVFQAIQDFVAELPSAEETGKAFHLNLEARPPVLVAGAQLG